MSLLRRPAWEEIEDLCRSEIEAGRDRLERGGAEARDELERGRIAAYRRILALAAGAEPPERRIQPDPVPLLEN